MNVLSSSNKKKILVTGGAGFIGSHLVDELLSRGNEVLVMDNLSNGSESNLNVAFQSKKFQFIKSDILEKQSCIENTQNVDVVYHLACLGVRHSLHSPFENHRVNAEGTLNILEAAVKNKVKKFFYISTSEIYGDTLTFPITESVLPSPTTVYGSSKLAGENYSLSYTKCFNLDTTVLRIFNNYGARAHYEGDSGEIIPRTIVNILYGESPVIFGDGSITRDFFYVRDTARVLADLKDCNGLKGEIINIGTGVEITMKHLISKIIEMMKREDIKIKYMEPRPADVPRLWVNAEKFYKLTNFKSSYSLENGLSETIKFYLDLMKEKNLINEVNTINWTAKK